MKLIKNATAKKLRGGFYTPKSIAAFILKWGINGNAEYEILEPSCGDGVFLEQLKSNNHKFKSITAIEFARGTTKMFYDGQLASPDYITIEDQEYFIMHVGEYEIGDEVIIFYLPKSKVILEIKDVD